MCIAIEFNKNEFSELELCGLRVEGLSVRTALTDKRPVIPVRTLSGNRLFPWGARDPMRLPKTGFCKKESLLLGKWAWLKPEPVEIIASRGFSNGVWFQIRRGIRGLLVKDPLGKPCVYLLTEPSTHYFRTMTGAERMPVLVGELI